MPTTPNGRKADGKTRYFASLTETSGEEPFLKDDHEFLTAEAGKTWIEEELKKDPTLWAELRRGVYESYDIDDEEYGLVVDAEYQQDESWYHEAWYNHDDDKVEWKGLGKL